MSNLGLTFDELIDTLAYGHEIDFSYAGKNYVLMPDINEKNEWEYIVYQVLPPENKPEIKVLYHTPLHRDPSFSMMLSGGRLEKKQPGPCWTLNALTENLLWI